MENYRRKFSRTVFNISSPPMFASFVKPVSAHQKSKKNAPVLSNYATFVNALYKKAINPAISVIIPVYNRKKYIGECLDSLLEQTFQNFEVIIIDDCSTDNSVEIVESYFPKFGERLKIIKLEKNTGHPGIPRNKGIAIAQGEYIYCLDSDDIITKTAFEEMYGLGKKYDADVVYCEKYYISEGVGQKFRDNIRVTDIKLQKPPFVDKPTLDPDDLAERVKKFVNWNYWVSPALRIVKRKLLIENNITFPSLVGSEDDVWSMKVLFSSKRFLRIPNVCFIRRLHEEGISFGQYTTSNYVQRWMDITIRCLKDLDTFMKNISFFKEKPIHRYEILERLINTSFNNIFDKLANESSFDIYSIFNEKFGNALGEYDVLISLLCTRIINQRRQSAQEIKQRIAEKDAEIRRLETAIYFPPLPAPRSTNPAISVIIPLYNTEKYVGECLDGLLAQTFQDFEVIVVDDCSTDDSVSIVESYIPKFNGRLTLTKTKVNSCTGGYVPRNTGFNLAKGEYVFFVDADDFILGSALEIFYRVAKKYNTDVVYSSSHYYVRNSNDVYPHRDGLARKLIKKGLKDEPALIVDNPNRNLHMLIFDIGFTFPWTKFIRRDFLRKNEIVFPEISKAGDHIWTIDIYCHANRVLRLPTPLYFYRDYNEKSLSRVTRSLPEQISYWVFSFAEWLKALDELANKTEILRENPIYCYEALKRDFGWLSFRLSNELNKSTTKDIYEILYNNLNKGKYLPYLTTVPFFFSFIDAEKKARKNDLRTIDKLKKELEQLKKSQRSDTLCDKDIVPRTSSQYPAISVIIAMYNTEKYIGECLDSFLAQTFKEFELIVIDDCSSDNSNAVVRSYAEKFNGRLKLVRLKKNSGNNGIPNNTGLALSRGEYVLFMDSDDTVTPDALEKLYITAKIFDAEVVACEKFYNIPEEHWNDLTFRKNLKPYSYQTGGFVSEPTLISANLFERVRDCAQKRFILNIWSKLIKRDFLINNEISITNEMANDALLSCFLVYSVEKFVRVPYVINYYRVLGSSITHQKRAPLKQMQKYLRALTVGFRHLDNFLSKREFFQQNPEIKNVALNTYLREIWDLYIKKVYDEVPIAEREEALRKEFSLADNAALTSLLFNGLSNVSKSREADAQIIRKVSSYLTARIDIEFNTEKDYGDFQLFSVSDHKATVTKPLWLNKSGIGYMIQSYEGKIEFVAKATAEGKIRLDLKGLDIRNPKDKSKRIPYWIDYTKLTVNGKAIVNKLTPAWHDKPYRYNIDVIANEEVTVQVEWFPHRGDVLPAIPKPSEKPKQPVVDNFLPNLTARLEVQMVSDTNDGDFQILSVSDKRAKTIKPKYLNKDGIGYQIQSYVGKIEFVAKATANGQVTLKLKGMDIRDPDDKSKLMPYWIDYTKLTVNGETIIDKLTPAWHDKPYRYDINVKADEEVKVEVEWFPHRGEILPAISKPVIDNFLPNLTARLDLQMVSDTGEGDFQILSVSDKRAKTIKPKYLNKDGIGYQIQSYVGKMKFVAKATANGQVTLKLKGMDIRDPDDKFKLVPYWIDYTKLTINGKAILDKLTPAWHNKPYRYDMNVKADEEVKVEVEWFPHRDDILQEVSKPAEKPVEVKFLPEQTSRLDLQMVSKTGTGDFKILSISDDKSKTTKPDFLNKDGIGYVIQSCAGKMEFVAKSTTDGKITLKLKGMDIRNPENKSKRVPYWIDYTKFTVNGKTIFDKITPAWHDKPYRYNINAKANEEIKIRLEWLPHKI